jgi:hypothetical protein
MNRTSIFLTTMTTDEPITVPSTAIVTYPERGKSILKTTKYLQQ